MKESDEIKECRKQLFEEWESLEYVIRSLKGIVQNPIENLNQENLYDWFVELGRFHANLSTVARETSLFVRANLK